MSDKLYWFVVVFDTALNNEQIHPPGKRAMAPLVHLIYQRVLVGLLFVNVVSRHLYAPIRNPSYNESNYRAIVSLPHWLN